MDSSFECSRFPFQLRFSTLPADALLMRSSGRTPASRSAVRKTVRPRLSLDGERWVNRTLEKMALREKLGQLLMVSFHGEFTSSESTEQRELQRAIEELRLGG